MLLTTSRDMGDIAGIAGVKSGLRKLGGKVKRGAKSVGKTLAKGAVTGATSAVTSRFQRSGAAGGGEPSSAPLAPWLVGGGIAVALGAAFLMRRKRA